MVRVRVLGPIEAEVGGRPVDAGGPRQRAVLALLLVGRGEVVSVDRLIEQLWRGEPPPRAIASLQAYVSNLRRQLEPDRPQRAPATLLVSRAPGYALRLPAEAVDAWRFEELLRRAQRAEPGPALELVTEALALWQGPAYAEFADEQWAAPEAARLDELRLAARELAVELTVRAGRAADAVAAAEVLTREHPLREEAWRLLALALWGSGRQADALAALRRARRALADELGLDPGPALAALEDAILHQRVAELGPAGPPAAAPEVAEAPDVFVGRQPELDRLRELAARARRSGGVGLVSGEAGLGKSSLLARARLELTAAGWTVAVGRCPEVDGAPPAWAWAEALSALAERHPPDDPAAVAPLLPRPGAADAEPGGDAATGRFRLHRAVAGWLRAAAGRAPLAVLLDDLHRADGETLALLESAARDLAGAPVLLLGAYRPAEGGEALEETLAHLARRSPERLGLGGLAAPDVAALVAAVHGPVDGPTVAALADRTGGNPFYVRESARLLAAEGALVALAEVPEGVRDVLRRRLARLPEAAVAVLRLAAVVGREAEVEVLVAAAEAGEDTVYDALETGVVAGLLGEPGPGRVRFAHALVRDTLYGDLTRLRRARMHGRVAEVLRRLRPDDLAALAHHYARTTGAGELAVEYGVRAAEQAERRYAHDSAARLLEQAVGCHEAMPVTDGHDDRLAGLLGRLLRAQLRAGALGAARATRQRALTAARAAGRDDLVVAAFTAWTEPTPWQARPYGTIDRPVVEALEQLLARDDLGAEVRCRLLDAFVSELTGEDDPRVRAAGAEAVALARTVGDPRLLAFTLATGIKATQVDGQIDEREALAVELAEVAGPLDLPAFRWHATYALASVAAVRGDVPAVRARLAEGLELTRRYRMAEAEGIHRFGDAMLDHIQGRFDEAERTYAAAAERLRRAGSVHAEGFLAVALCTLRVSQGRIGELEPMLAALAERYPDGRDPHALALAALGRTAQARAVRAHPAPVRPDYFFSVFTTLRALAVVRLGETSEAPGLIEQLLPLRDQLPGALSTTLALQPVALTLGQLCRLLGRDDEARAHFAHAEAVARRWGSPHWAREARAAR
ncbi:ATP-binding protein [Spirilliplanes yamanashiensis]|uniref:ATP-binding protein n=1 Tax=Spirilliplanes yamanashiensis TaxID=42233 RepID=UPI00194DCF6D|nr:BTAD domain-containing putative transcriptional regulator [Spirilliplanes yamanashiensis]MDP9819080.1 DNA-binding SARP family transcriptional activator/cytochrome c553 [Spirilliplanes yamanashiensis]